MKIFWPYRSKAKGFSIESLAAKYRENFSSLSSNEVFNDENVKSIKLDNNHIDKSFLNAKRGHWANRDFSEYREAA